MESLPSTAHAMQCSRGLSSCRCPHCMHLDLLCLCLECLVHHLLCTCRAHPSMEEGSSVPLDWRAQEVVRKHLRACGIHLLQRLDDGVHHSPQDLQTNCHNPPELSIKLPDRFLLRVQHGHQVLPPVNSVVRHHQDHLVRQRYACQWSSSCWQQLWQPHGLPQEVRRAAEMQAHLE